MLSKYTIPLLGLLVCMGSACTKDALDQKSNITLAVPSSIADYQDLLDGLDGGNGSYNAGLESYRSLTDFLCDEMSVSNSGYTTYLQQYIFVTDVLTWNKDLFNTFNTTTYVYEWNKAYANILDANLALEGLAAITPTPSNQSQWNLAEGMAFFLRGQMFLNVAELWSRPYNPATAAGDLGIVLKLHSEISEPSVRSTVQQTYNQILSDLKAALPLLPNSSSENNQLSKQRPSQAAAYGLLARTCMEMGDSANMLKYADSALQLYSTLMDYNTTTSFQPFNSETIYYTYDNEGTMGSFFGPWRIDSGFVNTYDANDLRKTVDFVSNSYVGGYAFVGDYSGYEIFTGIAVDELYLMRAEAYARTGNTAAAMTDLNTLLVKRYQTGTFTPRTAVNGTDALTQILTERTKELVHRGLWWADLRRLNQDPRFARTQTRLLEGVAYTLPPNDSRYTLQIPAYIIGASGGTITQNP